MVTQAACSRGYTHAQWKQDYAFMAEVFLKKHDTFTGEDLRLWIRAIIGDPYHPNCWGSASGKVLTRWMRDGRIYAKGHKSMVGPKANGRKTRIYHRRNSALSVIAKAIRG